MIKKYVKGYMSLGSRVLKALKLPETGERRF